MLRGQESQNGRRSVTRTAGARGKRPDLAGAFWLVCSVTEVSCPLWAGPGPVSGSRPPGHTRQLLPSCCRENTRLPLGVLGQQPPGATIAPVADKHYADSVLKLVCATCDGNLGVSIRRDRGGNLSPDAMKRPEELADQIEEASRPTPPSGPGLTPIVPEGGDLMAWTKVQRTCPQCLAAGNNARPQISRRTFDGIHVEMELAEGGQGTSQAARRREYAITDGGELVQRR